ncbi:putative phospholipid ABC transporter permease protein MlaE [Candidatus Xiphinematobacter sp. Idaho Grape]|nr:putative phospholipid ABC transporter permease protein MlaE [Candidatus Xiphinematobacter sp. Idaho Grape]
MLTAMLLKESLLTFIRCFGETVLIGSEAVLAIFRGRIRRKLVFQQIYEIGYRSQVVVVVTGSFTGAVFTAQTFFQFSNLNMESAVGPVVAVAMCRELGPVLAGLMVAGRVGAAMSAELGTMAVTQQIDALRALAVQPVDYLVVPRALAMLFSMPFLVGESIFFGISSSFVVAAQVLNVSSTYYLENMRRFTDGVDILMGITKGLVFGVLIVFISCQRGLAAKGGAVGVGCATTQSVVISSLAILITNFFLTMGLNVIFPTG